MKASNLLGSELSIDRRIITNVVLFFLLLEGVLFYAVFVQNELLITVAVIAAIVAAFVIFNKPEIGVLISIWMLFSAVSTVFLGGLFKVVVLFTLIAFIAAMFYRGERLVSDPLNKLVWPFTLLILISLLYVKDLELAVESLLEYLKALVLFILVSNLIKERGLLRRTFWLIILSGAYISAVNLYWLFRDPVAFAQRLGWPSGDPNTLALVLVSVVPFAYALTRSERSTPLRILALLCGLTVVAATFPTLSRGGILALFFVLMYILFKERKEKAVLYTFLALTLVGFYLLYTKFNFAIDILTERFGSLDRSVVQRYRLLKGGIAMFLDHPIFGVGIGNFLVYSISYTKLVGRLYAHNMFIHVAAELGIVAFALFTGIILVAFRKLRRIQQAAIQKANQQLLFQSRGIQISLLGLTICGMFLSQHFNKILWILLGLSVSMTQIANREGVTAKEDAEAS